MIWLGARSDVVPTVAKLSGLGSTPRGGTSAALPPV